MQSQAQVTINVINDNDHLPTFASPSYTFELAENSPAQALTTTNPAGLTMIQVSEIWIALVLSRAKFKAYSEGVVYTAS